MRKLRTLLFRAISNFSHQNLSAPHESFFGSEKKMARPILLFGFPRSGTTTFQKILSATLSYNSIFEPIHKNTTNYPKRKFDEVSNAFQMAPDSSQIDRFVFNSGAISHLHEISDQKIKNYYEKLLDDYLEYLFSYSGYNTVLKEIRFQGNVPTIINFFEKRHIFPLILLLEADPLRTLYSYYRLGGLVENQDYPTARVNEIYNYLSKSRRSFPEHRKLFKIHCKNKWERLLISNQSEILIGRHWVNQFPNYCLSVDFDNIKSSIEKVLLTLSPKIDVSVDESIIGRKRYQSDPLFFKKLSTKVDKEILEVAGINSKYPKPLQSDIASLLKSLLVHIQNKILEV